MNRVLFLTFWIAKQIGDEQRMTNLQQIIVVGVLVGMLVNMVLNR
jgi:hypothetical protein